MLDKNFKLVSGNRLYLSKFQSRGSGLDISKDISKDTNPYQNTPTIVNDSLDMSKFRGKKTSTDVHNDSFQSGSKATSSINVPISSNKSLAGAALVQHKSIMESKSSSAIQMRNGPKSLNIHTPNHNKQSYKRETIDDPNYYNLRNNGGGSKFRRENGRAGMKLQNVKSSLSMFGGK